MDKIIVRRYLKQMPDKLIRASHIYYHVY